LQKCERLNKKAPGHLGQFTKLILKKDRIEFNASVYHYQDCFLIYTVYSSFKHTASIPLLLKFPWSIFGIMGTFAFSVLVFCHRIGGYDSLNKRTIDEESVCMCINVRVYIHKYIYVRVCIFVSIYLCTYTHLYVYICTHIYMYIQTYTWKYIRINTYTYIYAGTPAHKYTQTRTFTCIHT